MDLLTFISNFLVEMFTSQNFLFYYFYFLILELFVLLNNNRNFNFPLIPVYAAASDEKGTDPGTTEENSSKVGAGGTRSTSGGSSPSSPNGDNDPGKGPGNLNFSFSELFDTIRSSLENFSLNLSSALGSKTESKSTATAKRVKLSKRAPNDTEMMLFPGVQNNNQYFSLTRKNLVKVTLVYVNDLDIALSAGETGTLAKNSFWLAPCGDWMGNAVDLLVDLRESLYKTLRKVQHDGVLYRTIRVQVYTLGLSINNLEPIPARVISSTPEIEFETVLTGRGAQELPQRNLTKQEKASLKQVLDFAQYLLVGAGENVRDTNRFSVIGHAYLNPLSLFVSNKQSSDKNVNLVEGSPQSELLEVSRMLSGTIQVNGVPFRFYDSFRGGKVYYPVVNCIVTGLRFTSGKGALPPEMNENKNN